MKEFLVIGIDFGTDSARAIVTDTRNGKVEGVGKSDFIRWKNREFCSPDANQFRQHPMDYIESLERAVAEAIREAGPGANRHINAISVDSTGSTPAPMDRNGRVLGLLPEFKDNPNAMFWLWKDHTSAREAREINDAAQRERTDYLKYQGTYSSEWFWAKILHARRIDPKICDSAYTWIEECDWLIAILCGRTDPNNLHRSACAAGHKVLWHSSFGGLPSRAFLASLDPYLGIIHDRYNTVPQTPDHAVGLLTADWAERWGLSTTVIVAGSQLDAHAGAVGAGIRPGVLVKVIGTSAVDLLVEKAVNIKTGDTKDVFGLAENSILPGYLGIEAGQAGFGDNFAWFKHNILMWAYHAFGSADDEENIEPRILPKLEEYCLREPTRLPKIVMLDWLNGRRYPKANESIRTAMVGFGIGTDVVELYRSLVLGTVFGSKRIDDAFVNWGIRFSKIIAVGGVAQKSPFVMQTMADVLDKPISVLFDDLTCAKGAAMNASVAAKIFCTIEEAQGENHSTSEREYLPRKGMVASYKDLYKEYLALGEYVDNRFELHSEGT